MAQIKVSDLTFCYEGSYDNIFEHVNLQIDSDWRCGLIGRNGKGKTTFLKLLTGAYEYSGAITGPMESVYFPYTLPGEARKPQSSMHYGILEGRTLSDETRQSRKGMPNSILGEEAFPNPDRSFQTTMELLEELNPDYEQIGRAHV